MTLLQRDNASQQSNGMLNKATLRHIKSQALLLNE